MTLENIAEKKADKKIKGNIYFLLPYVILKNDICLILYFAIDEGKRSSGYGSRANRVNRKEI
jgi:hypothetical protein